MGSSWRRATRLALSVGLFAALSSVSCTFVPLTTSGEEVKVLTLAEASRDCQRLGRTNSKTRNHVWIFARRDQKVALELESLARNEAPKIGGTAIAPMGKVTADGEQQFGIYRCGMRPGPAAESSADF